MPTVLLAAPRSLSGKTTFAVGLGARFRDGGRIVAVLRLTGDASAERDARLFAGLPFNDRREPAPVAVSAAASDADVVLVEAPPGDARPLAESLGAKAVAVVACADPLPADIASFCRALGDSCAGVAVLRVPARRVEATRAAVEATGVRLLALVPEDRTLAAPTLGAIAEALEAESSFLNSARDSVIDRPVISSISADPAQEHFDRTNPSAVVVRGDKPDQQIGALNAGAPCLIVTGGLPLLSYVGQRAEEEEIPLLRTRCDTLTALERLEALYGATPFSGRAKVERIAQLMDGLEVSYLA